MPSSFRLPCLVLNRQASGLREPLQHTYHPSAASPSVISPLAILIKYSAEYPSACWRDESGLVRNLVGWRTRCPAASCGAIHQETPFTWQFPFQPAMRYPDLHCPCHIMPSNYFLTSTIASGSEKLAKLPPPLSYVIVAYRASRPFVLPSLATQLNTLVPYASSVNATAEL